MRWLCQSDILIMNETFTNESKQYMETKLYELFSAHFRLKKMKWTIYTVLKKLSSYFFEMQGPTESSLREKNTLSKGCLNFGQGFYQWKYTVHRN